MAKGARNGKPVGTQEEEQNMEVASTSSQTFSQDIKD